MISPELRRRSGAGWPPEARVTKREDVVEIAAHLEVTGGRVEGGCHLHARYGRQCGGQEAGLQLAELLGAGTGVA